MSSNPNIGSIQFGTTGASGSFSINTAGPSSTLTVNATSNLNLDASNNVTIDANGTITLDASNNVTLNSPGSITLAPGDNGIIFQGANGGGQVGSLTYSAGNFYITANANLILDSPTEIAGNLSVTNGGTINGGAITGSSLSAGSGTINGGAITGSSLSAESGTITGGNLNAGGISAGSGTITLDASNNITLDASNNITLNSPGSITLAPGDNGIIFQGANGGGLVGSLTYSAGNFYITANATLILDSPTEIAGNLSANSGQIGGSNIVTQSTLNGIFQSSSNQANGYTQITFPSGASQSTTTGVIGTSFTPTMVFFSLDNTANHANITYAIWFNISGQGFTISARTNANISNGGSSNINVYWLAIGF